MIPLGPFITFNHRLGMFEVSHQLVGECYVCDNTGRCVVDDFGFLVEALPDSLMEGLHEFYGWYFPLEDTFDVTYRYH